MRVSLFSWAMDNVPKPQDLSWETFADTLGPHQYGPKTKLDQPAFSPAEFVPGLGKRDQAVLRVHFGVLDVDKVPEATLLAIVERVTQLGLDAVVYTTWSHPERFRKGLGWSVRVIVPFSRPVEAAEWPLFWAPFVALLGGADPQCKDATRIYYGPWIAPSDRLTDHMFHRFHGRALDPQEVFTRAAAAPVPSPTRTDKVSRDRLERLATKWKRRTDEFKAHMGDLLHKVCKGEAYANAGERDTKTFQLAQDLAEAFPNGDAASIAEHFAQSLQLMGREAPSLEDVQRKIERAQEGLDAEEHAEAVAALSERKLRIRQAFAHTRTPDRDTPYTEEELERFATEANTTRQEFRKRWIVQRGPSYYFHTVGRYSRPYTEHDAFNAALRDLAPASTAGVELFNLLESGAVVRKSLDQLIQEYGTVATHHVLDLRISAPKYDAAAQTFYEAPTPLRDLVPWPFQEVHTWLEKLFGPDPKDVHAGLSWIAHLTRLDDVCAGLLLTGRKGTGKSLLAMGLSRLWTLQGPTALSSAMATFNEGLAHCPLVFGDEQIPKDHRGSPRTAELREFVAARARPYRKKFQHDSTVLGAIRLLVAANNEEILSMSEHLTLNDIEAIADRFYHIKVLPGADAYLETQDTQKWIREDMIARHALFLRDTYPAMRQGRFLVKDDDPSFARTLTTRSGIRSALCQWCVGYLRAPQRVDAMGNLLARVKDGVLLVTPHAFLETWEYYVPSEPKPSVARITQGLQGLSNARRTLTRPSKGGPMTYREVDVEHLLAWAHNTEYATAEEIRDGLAVDTETRLQLQGRPGARPN
jgi:hypothetical protein